MGRVVSQAGMKSRNSTVINDSIFLAARLEWEEQKWYLQTSLPASCYPLRKYPNLSVTPVLCWWGYHQMLVSGGRMKHRCAPMRKHSCLQNWNFGGFLLMKKKAEIWKRWQWNHLVWPNIKSTLSSLQKKQIQVGINTANSYYLR